MNLDTLTTVDNVYQIFKKYNNNVDNNTVHLELQIISLKERTQSLEYLCKELEKKLEEALNKQPKEEQSNELDDFYHKLCEIHKTYFPDSRATQLYENFAQWYVQNRQDDPFFLSNNQVIEKFSQYAVEKWRYATKKQDIETGHTLR